MPSNRESGRRVTWLGRRFRLRAPANSGGKKRVRPGIGRRGRRRGISCQLDFFGMFFPLAHARRQSAVVVAASRCDSSPWRRELKGSDAWSGQDRSGQQWNSSSSRVRRRGAIIDFERERGGFVSSGEGDFSLSSLSAQEPKVSFSAALLFVSDERAKGAAFRFAPAVHVERSLAESPSRYT